MLFVDACVYLSLHLFENATQNNTNYINLKRVSIMNNEI